MRKYRVDITRIAESDIQEIFDYIARDNKAAAIKWVEEIERQIDSLENFPLRCPIIPEVQELGEKIVILSMATIEQSLGLKGQR